MEINSVWLCEKGSYTNIRYCLSEMVQDSHLNHEYYTYSIYGYIYSIYLYRYLYNVACRITLHVMDLHLLLSWAARLASTKVRTVHWVILLFHCSLGLPLPHFPSTMPSIRSRCRESCLMMCPKNDSFLIRTMSNNYRSYNTSSFEACLVRLKPSIRLSVNIKGI